MNTITITEKIEEAIEILQNFDYSENNTEFDEEFGEMTVKQSFEISLMGKEWKKFFPSLVEEGKIKTSESEGEVWNDPYYPEGYDLNDDRVYTLSPYLVWDNGGYTDICVSLVRS